MNQAALPFPNDTIRKILDAMTLAARAAESVIRDGATRRSSLVWETKSAADYVTEIDVTSERVIRDLLVERLGSDLGSHSSGLPVLGEESWKDEPVPDGLTFVVDPLDGTTNFLHGLPAYSVSIAALMDGEPLVALVLDIPHNTLFTAVRGAGAFSNGMPIHVSTITEPARALIATGFPFGDDADTVRYARHFVPVAEQAAGIRRVGSAALDLAWVAAGHFEAFWELSLSPWDIAAGILLVREAGGLVTTLDGISAGIHSSPIVAGNPAMHSWLLDVLQRADADVGA